MQSSTGQAQTPGGGSSVNILSSFPSRASPTPAIAVFKAKWAGVGGTVCASHESPRRSLSEGRPYSPLRLPPGQLVEKGLMVCWEVSGLRGRGNRKMRVITPHSPAVDGPI